MAVDFRIVIPARYASQRLPGKPLREINGKSMIEWVYLAARQSEAGEVVVATDDQRIADAVNGFGGSACLTSSAHRSGTDRILEVTQKLGWSDDTIVGGKASRACGLRHGDPAQKHRRRRRGGPEPGQAGAG
jgi:3-deoxy-manno-octulosonate cytidylyltransferase (CMP-KDO synthetase)